MLDAILRSMVEGVEAETGAGFFRSLVQHLASALGVQYAFVTEFTEERTAFRTLALWGRGGFLPDIVVPLAGTPCEAVLNGEIAHHPDRLQERFPEDRGLVDWHAESYAGVPLVDSAAKVIGHLAIIDDRPMPDGAHGLAVMRVFAARARAEIERGQVETALRESEARFRDLYEEAPVAYYSVGTDGSILYCNRRFSELFGYPPEALRGRSVFDIYADTPSGKPRARIAYERFLQGLETVGAEIECRRADGAQLWVSLSVRPMRDAQGRVTATRSTIVDLTERKRMEAELAASESRYRDLYTQAPAAYMSFSRDGRLIEWNRRAEELTGYGPDELRGLHFSALGADSAAGKPEQQRLYEQFLAGVETVSELEGTRPDGSRYWVRANVRPLRDGRGAIYATQSILIDITARKKAEQALRDSEERLARILHSAMDAIVTFDDGHTIELFNDAAEKVFGCPAAEAIGRPVERFLSDDFRRALEAAVRDGRPYVWAPEGLRARRADGSEFAAEATISQVEIGSRCLRTLILRDVDERQRAEAALNRLHRQNAYLQEEIKSVHNFEEIIGQSPALQAVLKKVGLVAGTDSSVLVYGETGTGKELIARAVHSNSQRQDRPLIKVNCAALPTGLIESELFGHEKGAFTGAFEKRIGRFELADGGTIFLDEIGELPSDVQVKLLRVLQEREFERVGGSATVKVDVRVIAATNRDLAKAVADGTFRQDLYYRLNVFPVVLPALRERPEDIPLLVHYFVARYVAKIGRRITRVPELAMRRLRDYAWPGNVRELENVVERAVILSAGPDLEIAAEVLPATAVPPPASVEHATAGSLEQVERNHILATLKQTNWRVDGPNGAARILNLHPSTLRSRMQKLGIRRSASELS